MHTEISDDPIVELRLYSVAPGRVSAMEARVTDDLSAIFPRHGIRPLAQWSITAGAGAPLFVYLTPWRNMQQRSAAWAGFYADPAWLETRARTNDGSELVETYEIVLLRAMTEWTAGPGGTLTEMVVQQVAVGKSAAVRAELLEHTVPALQSVGAHVHAIYDMMTGGPLPAVILFVSWNSLEQRMEAMAALNLRSIAARAVDASPLLGRATHTLMRALAVAWKDVP